MQAFEYGNPTTLAEAFKLLGTNWGEAEVLAGGTDLHQPDQRRGGRAEAPGEHQEH